MEPTRPKVTHVEPKENHRLLLTFDNGEERIFDATPYLKNFFSELEDPSYFNKVFVEDGSIGWPHGQDLAYDMLYFKSKPLAVKE
jgi:hypothetical protein